MSYVQEDKHFNQRSCHCSQPPRGREYRDSLRLIDQLKGVGYFTLPAARKPCPLCHIHRNVRCSRHETQRSAYPRDNPTQMAS